MLDRPVKLRSNNMQLEQEAILVEPTSMHEELFRESNRIFQRDDWKNEDVVDIPHFLHDIPQSTFAEFPPITAGDLRAAVRVGKKSSGRGCDAFSIKDLAKLPTVMMQFLANLLMATEQWGHWPSQWVTARTVCLPKKSEKCHPMDIRPVTVMARAYRLWGKIRGAQASNWLAQQIPATIGGPPKRISSDMIALLTAQKIEHAMRSMSHDQALTGLVTL